MQVAILLLSLLGIVWFVLALYGPVPVASKGTFFIPIPPELLRAKCVSCPQPNVLVLPPHVNIYTRLQCIASKIGEANKEILNNIVYNC